MKLRLCSLLFALLLISGFVELQSQPLKSIREENVNQAQFQSIGIVQKMSGTIKPIVFPEGIPAAYPASSKLNYMRCWTARLPETDPMRLVSRAFTEVQQTTHYTDGLGRDLQTVIRQGALKTGLQPRDFVTAFLYDRFGRKTIDYLSFPAIIDSVNNNAGQGNFQMRPFSQQQQYYSVRYPQQLFFYNKTVYEASPLDRVLKVMPPGNSWVGSNVGVSYQQKVNASSDSVRIWKVITLAGDFGNYFTNACYPAGTLHKLILTDEQGNQMIEMRDKAGRTILRKVQQTKDFDDRQGMAHTDWLCTYFIYDDSGMLHAILQPEGVKNLLALNWRLTDNILAEQCFRYAYDEKKRVVLKQLPGSGTIQMVYDARSRLVLLQDANMKKLPIPQWYYMQYDQLNRLVRSGIWFNSSTRRMHNLLSKNSINYPDLRAQSYEELTSAHYDDYSNLPPGFSAEINNADTRYFFNGPLHATPEFAEPWQQSLQTKGLLTWTRTKIPGTTLYVCSVKYYDDKARIIQEQSQNITGGTSVISFQYNFSGQLIRTLLRHNKGGKQARSIPVCTKNTWDELGRLSRIEKRYSLSGPLRTIAEYGYNEEGKLVTKKLGVNPAGAGPLETMEYDYNIRGWMLGSNQRYLHGQSQKNNCFGYSLSYDTEQYMPGNGIDVSQKFNPQLDGNISSFSWKSSGDHQWRRYDFSYDAANRITGADFNQFTGGKFTKSAGFDFSMRNLRYDMNGNILSLSHAGWKPGGSSLIDSLNYSYLPASNKLKNVIDRVNDTATGLGDFRSSANYMKSLQQLKNYSAIDYCYDDNGNLIADRNKDIASISYNFLNLPVKVDFGKKGNINYTWSADGIKLKKTVTDSIGKYSMQILYIDGAVYQSKQHFVSHDGDYTDSLLYFLHEEGYTRFRKDSVFQDYFIKDHQSNIRMVITEERRTDMYPPASMELIHAATEEKIYSNLPATRVRRPAGYPAGTAVPNEFVSLVQGDGRKIGAGMLLKVMSGDRFSIQANSWYKMNVTPAASADIMPALVSALTAAIPAASAGKLNARSMFTILDPAVTLFLKSGVQKTVAGKPAAFLNFLLLDEQFKAVITNDGRNSGALPVGVNNELSNHQLIQREITHSGYLFVFLSNATPGVPVYFDNLQMTHYRGGLLEENHYYPFGLVMHGISSRAYNATSSGLLHAGRELQRNEFNSDPGLQSYDFGKRMYDVQTGRWFSTDGAAEKYPAISPWTYAGNNPVNTKELNGNLFVFASGFMLNQYLKGDGAAVQHRNQQLIDKGTYLSWYSQEPNIHQYAPDRDFFRALPRNNGEPFPYWEGVDNNYRTYYQDNNAFYINGSFTPKSKAKDRFDEGAIAGRNLIAKLDAGDISLSAEETIKIVGHSQGAAFAAGIATELAKHAKYGSRLEFADYIAPHQPGDFTHPSSIPGRQFSTATDVVSSGYGIIGGILNLLNGGSSLEKINGVQDGLLRFFHFGGKGGHYVDTWAEDLKRYFEKEGIKVTIQ